MRQRAVAEERYNRELEELYNEPNIFNVIKSSAGLSLAARSEASDCGRSTAGDCGFESHRGGHGCQSVVSVVCCQVSARG